MKDKPNGGLARMVEASLDQYVSGRLTLYTNPGKLKFINPISR